MFVITTSMVMGEHALMAGDNTYMLLEWYHNPSVSRFPSGF
jgi:hypothetical protein